MQAFMSVVFEYWEENFKIYGLYFLQDALCFFACPHLVVYAKRKRVRMCRKKL